MTHHIGHREWVSDFPPRHINTTIVRGRTATVSFSLQVKAEHFPVLAPAHFDGVLLADDGRERERERQC